MRKSIFLTLVMLCALASEARSAESPCKLVQAASTAMSRDEGKVPSIPVKINDRPAALLADPGGAVSVISPVLVHTLALERKPIPPGALVLSTGESLTEVATVDTLTIGNLVGHGVKFFVAPRGVLPPSLGGTFGADFLRAWDVDFDFGSNKFSLVSPKHCKGNVVYWTQQPYVARPFILTNSFHIRLKVNLDGKALRAIVDTGSTVSSMDLELARRLYGSKVSSNAIPQKLPINAMKSWKRHGYGYEDGYGYDSSFEALDLDGIMVKKPKILLVPDLEIGNEHLILGMSILNELHLYIAYKERMLYITAADTHKRAGHQLRRAVAMGVAGREAS